MMTTRLGKHIWVAAILATLVVTGDAWAPPPPVCNLPIDFNGGEYTMCFTDVRRGAGINDDGAPDLGGTGHTALNFTGSAGPAGDTWLTTYTPGGLPQIFDASNGLCMAADVLIHTYNNAKGAGVVALLDSTPGGKGLALILYDQGNSDALQLATIDPATGRLVKLTSVNLGSGIVENAWYEVSMILFTGPDSFHVTATVFRHATPTDPNSFLAGPVGPELVFGGSLSATGLEDSGEVGIAASAVSTSVNSSVTNWNVNNCPA